MTLLLCILNQILCLVSGIIPIDTVAYRMEQQKWLYPQERVFVSTDAEEYAAGDTIRMEVNKD